MRDNNNIGTSIHEGNNIAFNKTVQTMNVKVSALKSDSYSTKLYPSLSTTAIYLNVNTT